MVWIGMVLSWLIGLYLTVLTVRAILSFVPIFVPDWRPRGAMLVFAEAIYSLTDPPLKAIGRVVPVMRIGGVGFDLGFLILYFGLSFLQRFVRVLFL